MSAAHQLNPSDLSNEQLDRMMFALMGRMNLITVVEKPMTPEEAAAYLKITKKTLYQRINKGTIPENLIHRQDGSVYFLPSEIVEFIKQS